MVFRFFLVFWVFRLPSSVFSSFLIFWFSGPVRAAGPYDRVERVCGLGLLGNARSGFDNDPP